MNRTLLIVMLGLLAGAGTHFLYFGLHEPDVQSLDSQLAWMKSELNLNEAQFTRIKELHQVSSPRLHALADQVAQLQAEFAAFEATRRNSNRVDFIEFARFVEARRQINDECLDSTRQLIVATAEVMTPRQRQHYIQLIAVSEPLAQSLLN
jgi:hypothetical protein